MHWGIDAVHVDVHDKRDGPVGAGVEPVGLRATVLDMTERPARLREAYDALWRGDLAPWNSLLDPRVVWRAADRPDDPETPT